MPLKCLLLAFARLARLVSPQLERHLAMRFVLWLSDLRLAGPLSRSAVLRPPAMQSERLQAGLRDAVVARKWAL
ncbi:hypothetical protein PM02_15745 [Sulfitobacter mediterraneus]|uniref:Transposase n=1 Tax=Sulfitobacter mediterraneus TaxID=83219 RepID=A0A061SML9_9RHOB|nr:hypothetical protein PM02_15745 [Sulfitobacter mediterraneus]